MVGTSRVSTSDDSDVIVVVGATGDASGPARKANAVGADEGRRWRGSAGPATRRTGPAGAGFGVWDEFGVWAERAGVAPPGVLSGPTVSPEAVRGTLVGGALPFGPELSASPAAIVSGAGSLSAPAVVAGSGKGSRKGWGGGTIIGTRLGGISTGGGVPAIDGPATTPSTGADPPPVPWRVFANATVGAKTETISAPAVRARARCSAPMVQVSAQTSVGFTQPGDGAWSF